MFVYVYGFHRESALYRAAPTVKTNLKKKKKNRFLLEFLYLTNHQAMKDNDWSKMKLQVIY